MSLLDDVIAATGKGDMAITPDDRMTVVGAWKALAAYRTATEGDQ